MLRSKMETWKKRPKTVSLDNTDDDNDYAGVYAEKKRKKKMDAVTKPSTLPPCAPKPYNPVCAKKFKCPCKCEALLNDQEKQTVFNEFWLKRNFVEQILFLLKSVPTDNGNSITTVNPKRYKLCRKKNASVELCKVAVCCILDIRDCDVQARIFKNLKSPDENATYLMDLWRNVPDYFDLKVTTHVISWLSEASNRNKSLLEFYTNFITEYMTKDNWNRYNFFVNFYYNFAYLYYNMITGFQPDDIADNQTELPKNDVDASIKIKGQPLIYNFQMYNKDLQASSSSTAASNDLLQMGVHSIGMTGSVGVFQKFTEMEIIEAFKVSQQKCQQSVNKYGMLPKSTLQQLMNIKSNKVPKTMQQNSSMPNNNGDHLEHSIRSYQFGNDELEKLRSRYYDTKLEKIYTTPNTRDTKTMTVGQIGRKRSWKSYDAEYLKILNSGQLSYEESASNSVDFFQKQRCKNYGAISENMKRAIESLTSGELSYKEAAKKFNVFEKTLYRIYYLSGSARTPPNRPSRQKVSKKLASPFVKFKWTYTTELNKPLDVDAYNSLLCAEHFMNKLLKSKIHSESFHCKLESCCSSVQLIETEKQSIFTTFWSLDTWFDQMYYLSNRVVEGNNASTRKKFILESSNNDGDVFVCEKTLCSILNIQNVNHLADTIGDVVSSIHHRCQKYPHIEAVAKVIQGFVIRLLKSNPQRSISECYRTFANHHPLYSGTKTEKYHNAFCSYYKMVSAPFDGFLDNDNSGILVTPIATCVSFANASFNSETGINGSDQLDNSAIDEGLANLNIEISSLSSTKCIVYGNHLMKLFRKCRQPRCASAINEKDVKVELNDQSVLCVRWKCEDGGHCGMWKNQSVLDDIKPEIVGLSSRSATTDVLESVANCMSLTLFNKI